MEGRYQFNSPEWDDRSDTVKDLVRLAVCQTVPVLMLRSAARLRGCSSHSPHEAAPLPKDQKCHNLDKTVVLLQSKEQRNRGMYF